MNEGVIIFAATFDKYLASLRADRTQIKKKSDKYAIIKAMVFVVKYINIELINVIIRFLFDI